MGDNIVDQWLISNLQTLKKNIAKEMEDYKLYNVVPSLFTCIEDLTNWYIRLNRARFWGEGLSDDKCAAYSTLYTAINEISKAMAPFTPFMSEYIYKELLKFDPEATSRPNSVHLCPYPEADEALIKPALEEAVEKMQQLILLGRQKRNQVQIKTKTPLATLTIIHQDKAVLDEISRLELYIKSELNVKSIEYSQEEDKFIKLFAKPNSRVLGKRLGKEFGKFMKIIQALPADQLAKYEADGSLEVEGQTMGPDDIFIFREAKEGTQALSNRYISIDLDCELTPELVQEGLAREVVNRIQKTRKDLNFNVEDRIDIKFTGSSEIEAAMLSHPDYICRETLADSLNQGIDNLDSAIKYQIESFELNLLVSKK